ncbi:MAG: DNA mismatch repair endonuclease MutL [Bacteriovoracia bacterium]
MNKIKVLPISTAQKIAAGEVIERPSSVVKELVENAIDAGATQIEVEIADGGLKKIRVTDNGEGILKEDLPLTIKRHATSKIETFEDIYSVSTMGFRGEALASIHAVSRLTIDSKRQDSEINSIYFEGSEPKENPQTRQEGLRFSSGTTILVEDLFFNVPARLRFMRSKNVENSNIRELVQRIALCHPEISFFLSFDGKKPVKQDLQSVFGTDDLESFETHFENISARGVFARSIRAQNSKEIYLSVNKRMVKDKLLIQAVLSALRPVMMEGEFPKVLLELSLPPSTVDVNIHPAKTEVRFHRAKDVFQVIHGALSRLSKQISTPYYSTSLANKSSIQEKPTEQPQRVQSLFFKNEQVVYKSKQIPQQASGPIRTMESSPSLIEERKQTQERTLEVQNAVEAQNRWKKLHYIGQLKNTYLLFQDEEGLVLVDQHAAHERVQYEKIRKDFLQGLQAQPLLMGVHIKLNADEKESAFEHAEELRQFGFEFEDFGENTLVLRSIPEAVDSKHAKDLFTTLVGNLNDETPQSLILEASILPPRIERMLSTTACHSSVRAGQALSEREAIELLETMENTPSSLNCPHGRPASIRLKFEQIENLFKR